jgi:hypothetical protein
VTDTLTGGLLLALGSAAALNWGFLRQHRAASSLPPLTVRRPIRSLHALFSNPGWLLGFGVGLTGWALYVTALGLAPLSLVQAVSAGGIGLLALLVERTTDTRLSHREWVAVGTAVTGLVLLGVSLVGQAGGGHRGSSAVVAVWVAGSLFVAALAAGPGAKSLAGGAGFGVAAGVLYAAGDVATKAAVAGGAAVAFVAAVLACHGLAFVSLQLGFQRGDPLSTVGLSSLLTNAVPIVAGMAVFGEGLPGGALGVARLLAFICVVTGAALLARPDGGMNPRPVETAVQPTG